LSDPGHIGVAIGMFGFWSVTNSTIETFDPENIGVAVGMLFLANLEFEKPLGVV